MVVNQMGKKKKESANLIKPRSKTMQYACPFCHAQNHVRISIRKNKESNTLEGFCQCNACKKQNIIPKLHAIDTENNVYARWCDYARQLSTFGVKCCGAMTILQIQKIGEQTIGIVHCYEENHEEKFIKRESETVVQFKERVENDLNNERRGGNSDFNVEKKKRKGKKISGELEKSSEYSGSEVYDEESYDAQADASNESEPEPINEVVERPEQSDDDI